MIKFVALLILITFLVLTGCDFDKFTGSKTVAEPIPDVARLFGQIINKFTGEAVSGASIRAGNQAAFSDEEGNYLLYYHLQDDDLRNKPLQIRFSASRFQPLDSSIVVYPENRLNIKLEYGAPIIRRVARVGSVCQAEVFDYQGQEDVVMATAFFSYIRSGERSPSAHIVVGLQKVESDSENVAYFQGAVEEFIPEYGNLMNSFRVEARDKTGLVDSTSNARVGVDTLLFPVAR